MNTLATYRWPPMPRSFGISLVFAILLHALLIVWVKLPRGEPLPRQISALTVSLSPRFPPLPAVPAEAGTPPRPPDSAVPLRTIPQARAPAPSKAVHPPLEDMARPPLDNPAAPPAAPQKQAPSPAPIGKIDLEQSAAIARQAGIESERGGPSPAPPQPAGAARERSLEQVVAAAFAGKSGSRINSVTRDANGVIRVTTAYGTEVCYKASELLGMNGPVEPLAIPMTCP